MQKFTFLISLVKLDMIFVLLPRNKILSFTRHKFFQSCVLKMLTREDTSFQLCAQGMAQLVQPLLHCTTLAVASYM